jgi:hypothetical protein
LERLLFLCEEKWSGGVNEVSGVRCQVSGFRKDRGKAVTTKNYMAVEDLEVYKKRMYSNVERIGENIGAENSRA